MAHHVEPMDIDSDFDNKENSLHHNNVLPFTEKGYEELDVSELNMKLRYSVTPASSPMSKSFTANCTDNRSLESGDESLNVTVNENFNLTNSLNSTLTKNDNIIKTLKVLPLQALPTEQFVDSNRNTSVLRSIDSAVTPNNGNITVTVSGPSDIDENLSLPSSSSSALHTPESTTPTKDIAIKDGGSPIMRGLKSVLNMFRSSQSPIPSADNEAIAKLDMLSPAEVPSSVQENKSQTVLASTPIAAHRKKEMSPTKRSSPQKESSVVFNDDLEKELQWKDETTIIFSQERIPIHKLMLQQPQESKTLCKDVMDHAKTDAQDLNSTVEYMDISYNDSFRDRTMTEIQVNDAKVDGTLGGESDSEFVDCETTFTKNKSTAEDNDITPVSNVAQDLDLTIVLENKNDSGSRLKQIILDTTQDILDATLSVRPEDLLPELSDQTQNVIGIVLNKTEVIDASKKTTVSKDFQAESSSLQFTQPMFNQTVDISNPIVLEVQSKESKDLDNTKTLEETTTTQPINQTFDAVTLLANEKENLDATKTLENVLGITHILESNESDGFNCTNTIDILTTANKEFENLNCTKTIEITTTHNVNQTFDAAGSITNERNQKENLDVTRTLENNLGVTQILENNESQILNYTTTIHPINQTFDSARSGSNEKEKENLHVTNTLENILGVTHILESNKSDGFDCTNTIDVLTTAQTANQTFDVSNSLTNDIDQNENLDTTKTLENVLGVTQILEKNESKDLNCTKTIEVRETKHTMDHTFDAVCVISSVNQGHLKENLVEENKLVANAILQNQPDIANDPNKQTLNTTVVLDDNKMSENKVISVIDNVITKNNETMLEIQSKMIVPSAETSVMPILDIAPLEEPFIKPMPIPVNNDNDAVLDVTMTKLPVDIPLPDEDDLDKELNMPIDATAEVSPRASLPLDLVDDIKISTAVNQTVNMVIEENEINLNENSNIIEVILPEACDPRNNTNLESGDNIINETVVEKITNANKNYPETIEQINIENTNLLPEVTSTLNIITQNVEEVVMDKITVVSENNESYVALNLTETINAYENVENINHDILQKQDVAQNDDKENVSTLKPLPDIINQAITISSTESISTSPVLQENMLHEKVGSNLVINDNTIGETVIPKLNVHTIEQPQTSIIDIEKSITQDKLFVTSSGEAIALQEFSNMVLTSGTANISTLPENVTDAIALTNSNAIPTESSELDIGKVPDEIEESERVTMAISNTKEADEEIILSENNSPFVSVIADNIPEPSLESSTIHSTVEDTMDALATNNKIILTPPTSPPIQSKGYNFNFDDMDFNPFATKTNIRMSPPLASPNKFVESNTPDKAVEKPVPKKDLNRRKSQPERKKPTMASKRKFNATFDNKINDKPIDKSIQKIETASAVHIQLDSPATIALSPQNVTIEEKEEQETLIVTEIANEPENIEKPIESSADVSDNSIESNVNDLKATSSSEQSTYFSACTTSSESSIPPRNVFNLPEIDDINFNPFATKSKMRQSPPPEDNPFATKSKIMSSPDSSMIIVQKSNVKVTLCEDKIETEPMEKDASGSLSNTSKSTDEKNVTTKEIHTEDEDTIEGPFLDSEDLNPDEKIADLDSENIDMLNFNDLPPQSSEDNLDNGEMFIDAEAFEFLLNQNKSNTVTDSGKESLFLKFDPLFAKRMSAVSSDGVLASLAKLQKRQSTPTKPAQTPPNNVPSPIAGPSNLNVTQDMDMNISEDLNDDLNITVSKPMMVVPPAVNPVTPRNKSLTPNRSNRRSITFTSPAMAVIDRLLSLSSNNSLMHDTTVTQVSREQNEADIALSQLRELLAEKEINVYNLKCESNELRDRLNTLEGHVKNLEAESEDRLKKINQLNDTLVEKTKINKSMAAVVEEYERTIASLIAETAQDKKKHAEERIKLINERDEQTAHLASMEVSFSDLHSKYEKSKQLIFNCKANEEVYKKSIKDFEENLTKMHNNYELLKQHATSKLNHANQELEKINRSHEAEVLKLNAMIKRKELHITSLEESLAQKTKANDELTAICDELINKVG